MAEATTSHSPNKRKRLEEVSEPAVPVASMTRSDIWFDDGNIVIQAESTQFKVHRSVLAAHSLVFKEMFSILELPTEQGSAVEGCPVFQVSDSAVDIAIVLRALCLRGYAKIIAIDRADDANILFLPADMLPLVNL